MQFLSLEEVLYLHALHIATSGGSEGLRDRGALESALAQPQMTFGGEDLYPTLLEKAAALGFSLILNHPFVDGNKRVGFGAMNLILKRNGQKVQAEIDEAEAMVLGVAAGEKSREELIEWLKERAVSFT